MSSLNWVFAIGLLLALCATAIFLPSLLAAGIL